MKLFKYFLLGDVYHQDGQMTVYGRAGHRWQVGDEFNLKFKFEARKCPEDWAKPAKVEIGWPITLKITKIELYGKEFDHMSPGDTGVLWLEGNAEIEHGWNLGYEAEFTYEHKASYPGEE